ncbi:uncharacterized protein [Antedon mediterranea]|uniref:uncharacterized protein isoform X2 n=1 Tax=Antedon mediterranea TaxID=105859 RepID=UPI003AF920FB
MWASTPQSRERSINVTSPLKANDVAFIKRQMRLIGPAGQNLSKKMYRAPQKQGAPAVNPRYIMFPTDPGRQSAYEHAVSQTDALSSIKISDARSLAQCVPRISNNETPSADARRPTVRSASEQPLDLSVKRPRVAEKGFGMRYYVNEQGRLVDSEAFRQRSVVNHPRDSRRELLASESAARLEAIQAQKAWMSMLKHRQNEGRRVNYLEHDAAKKGRLAPPVYNHQPPISSEHSRGETALKTFLSTSGSSNAKMMYKKNKDIAKYDINSQSLKLEQHRQYAMKRPYQAMEPRETAKIKEFHPVRIALVAPRKKESNEKRRLVVQDRPDELRIRKTQDRLEDARIRKTCQSEMVRGRTFFPPVMSVNDVLNQLPEAYKTTAAQTQAVLLQNFYARATADPAAFGLIHNSMAAGKKINKLLKSLNNETSARPEPAKFCVASRGGLKGIRRQQMEDLRRTSVSDTDGINDQEIERTLKDTPERAVLTSSSNALYFKHLARERYVKERRQSLSQTPKVGRVSTSTNTNCSKSETRVPNSSNARENRYQVVINKKHQPIKLSVTPPASNQIPSKTVSAKNLSVSTVTHQSIQPAPPSIIPKRMAEKRIRHGVHNRHREDTKMVSPEFTYSPKAGTIPNALHDYYSNVLFGGSRTTESDPLGEMIRAELDRKGLQKSDRLLNREPFHSAEKEASHTSREKNKTTHNDENMNTSVPEIARQDMLKKQFKLSCVETNGDRTDQENKHAENRRRLREESLRGLSLEGLHNPCKLPTVNSSPLTSPISDQPSPPMPILTPQRTVHAEEERVRSGDSPIPVLKDARHEGPNFSMSLSTPSRHEFKVIPGSLPKEEHFRSNLQHRFEIMKPHATTSHPENKPSDVAIHTKRDLKTAEKIKYGESVSQGTKAALQEIFKEADDQVASYQMYRQMLNQNVKEEDRSIFSRLNNLREENNASCKPDSKPRKSMDVIDLTDSCEASPSSVHHPVDPQDIPSLSLEQHRKHSTDHLNSEDGEIKESKDLQQDTGCERLPHDSPFRKVYRTGMKHRALPPTCPKPSSPAAADKFTARFSDPNVLKLPKETGKHNIVVAKTVWPSESEQLLNTSEVKEFDDAVDYFGRSVPEHLEDVTIPAIRFPQSEDLPDQVLLNRHSRTPSVSPRRDGLQMLDVDRMEQRLKNLSPTVTTLTGETIIKPPRKRPLEISRIANSDGFVAEAKAEKHEDLLNESVSLDREERALKECEIDWRGVVSSTKPVPLNRRAILQFNQMEAKEKVFIRNHDNDTETQPDNVIRYDDGDQKLLTDTEDNDDNVFVSKEIEAANDQADLAVLSSRRTRNAGARPSSTQKPYNKNARYELEIEKEQAKYWQRRRQRSTSVSVSEDDSPPAKRPPGRPPKTDRERKLSTNSTKNTKTAHILSEKIKMKYKGCGRGKYPRVRKISLDSRKSRDDDAAAPINLHLKLKNEYDAETITEEIPISERRKSSTSSAGKRSMRCVVDPCNPHKMKFVAISGGKKHKMKTKHLEDDMWSQDGVAAEPDEGGEFDEESDFIKCETESLEFERPEPPPDFRKILANKKLGETILHRAARLGYDDVAIYCVEYCILDINAKDNAGYTALHECCVHGRLKIAHTLLSYGADVNAGAVDGTRPIHDAVDNDHVEVVRLLLSFGADPLLATYSGRTTLKLARSKDARTLLYGFLTDINGSWEMGEDEEPLTDKELRWQFGGSSSLFDDTTDSCYNIFEDIPGPDSDTEDDFEIELSDSPHLNTFNLQVDKTKGPLNWCLLVDVCQTVSIPREQFETVHPTIEIVCVDGEELIQSVCHSQIMTSSVDQVNAKDQIEIVELNDDVRKLLDVETMGIK